MYHILHCSLSFCNLNRSLARSIYLSIYLYFTHLIHTLTHSHALNHLLSLSLLLTLSIIFLPTLSLTHLLILLFRKSPTLRRPIPLANQQVNQPNSHHNNQPLNLPHNQVCTQNHHSHRKIRLCSHRVHQLVSLHHYLRLLLRLDHHYLLFLHPALRDLLNHRLRRLRPLSKYVFFHLTSYLVCYSTPPTPL